MNLKDIEKRVEMLEWLKTLPVADQLRVAREIVAPLVQACRQKQAPFGRDEDFGYEASDVAGALCNDLAEITGQDLG